jgi:hypothetical protein
MNIAITPDSKTAYVANASTGTITPIRTATDTALTKIRLADGAGAHRDHPGRPDRLRDRRLRAGQNGHRHPDPDRHEPGTQGDHSQQPALGHRDHPGAAPLTGLASHSFRPCCPR